MIRSFINWFKFHLTEIAFILIIVSLSAAIFNLVDVVKKPPEVKELKGSIQNHLTWSVKGECYFVQPYSNGTVYLIRVEDCDKDIKR